MIAALNPLREISFISVLFRLLLAACCGGIVGVERSFRRRAAGFRTHILTCLGAAMTTMTSEYLIYYMHYHTDVGRMGAQVIAGIGFIGAGTIIVTHRNRVKGLTTAAGFWAAAIVGLAVGFGYYEAAVVATILILLIENLLIKLENKILVLNPEATVYIESIRRDSIESILGMLQEKNISVQDLEISQLSDNRQQSFCAILNLRLPRGSGDAFQDLLGSMASLEGIITVEEL